jgi:hypothetical protein
MILLFMLQGIEAIPFIMLGPIFNILFEFYWVKAHHDDPFCGTFGSSIIIHAI